MKRINMLWLMALAILASCTSEVDDVFDKSASARIEEAVKADKEILTSAANGWVMYYYGNKNYGGYNVLCKFNADETVTVSSEMYDSDATETTHYSVGQSAGIILSFDEYNTIFHWFSDPVNPGGIGTNGSGFEGDLEFRIISASPERIVLKGKKTENDIVMVPLPAGTTWKDYLETVAEAEEEMAFSQYYYVVGSDSILMTNTNRNLYYSYVDTAGVAVNAQMPYVVTPEGYLFYEDMELLGVKADRLDYKGGANYEFDTPSGTAKLYGQTPPPNQLLNDGTTWYVTYAGMGPTCQAMWDKARVGIQTQTAFSGDFDLQIVEFESSVLYVYISYWGYLNMKCSTPDNEHVVIQYDTYGNSNAQLFLQYMTDFDLMYKPFVGTFTVTAEEGRNPTWLKLTSTTDPNQYITLYKQGQYVY